MLRHRRDGWRLNSRSASLHLKDRITGHCSAGLRYTGARYGTAAAFAPLGPTIQGHLSRPTSSHYFFKRATLLGALDLRRDSVEPPEFDVRAQPPA